MTTGYAALQDVKDELIRKTLNGGVHLADYSADALALTDLFDDATGILQALPAGYWDVGYLTTDGAKVTRSLKTSAVASWQSAYSTRIDVTGVDVTLQFSAQETKLHTISMATGVAESAISTTPNAGGAIEIDIPAIPRNRNFRAVVFGVDVDDDGETIIARFLPKARISDHDDQVFANGDSPLLSGVTMTGTLDATLGYSEAVFFGGDGWKAKLTAMGFTAGGGEG